AYRRYNDIVCSGFRLEWEERRDELTIHMHIGESGTAGTRHCIEDMASSLYRLIGRLCSRPIPISEAAFAHARPAAYDPAPYLEAFGIEPRFGAGINYLRLSRDVLGYPVLYADDRLHAMFTRIAEETMERLGRRGAFARDVSQWIMNGLPARLPSLKQTAAAFHMSERTLQS